MDIYSLAADYGVPLADAQMIALNAYGLSNASDLGRARCIVHLDESLSTPFRSILATDREESPFCFESDTLLLEGQRIGEIRDVEHDDARLGYFRNDGKTLTLNTNARSHCTGCVFCPNTGSEASDPKVNLTNDEFNGWIDSLVAKHGFSDLGHVEQANLSTSCFGEEGAALAHLAQLSGVLADHGFRGRIGILSSVIRSRAAFSELADRLGSFALFLTLECVTRRSLWLKDSKASLTPEAGLEVLSNARAAGCDTGVTLVVGLDPISDLLGWLDRATPFLTDFPNLQVFQVHSRFMASAGVMGSDPLAWFIEARIQLEQVLCATGLKPSHWQNYRPFWYTDYCGASPG